MSELFGLIEIEPASGRRKIKHEELIFFNTCIIFPKTEYMVYFPEMRVYVQDLRSENIV